MRPGMRRNQKKDPKIAITDYADAKDYREKYSKAASRLRKEARLPKIVLTREEVLAKRKQYMAKYFAKLRSTEETRKELNRKHTIRGRIAQNKHRITALSHYGVDGEPVCRWCGFDDPRALAIDHTNNNGAAHRKTLGGAKIHTWLVRRGFPEGFQTLCFNCNAIKEYDRQTRIMEEEMEIEAVRVLSGVCL